MRVRDLLTTTTLFPSVSSAFKYNLGGRAHNTHTQRYLSTHRSLRMAQDAAAEGAEVVVALDFDGVLCNSVGESSRSAFLCLQKRYPDVLKGTEWENLEDSDAPAWLMDKMRKLRPVVETGYENILLTRLLLEEYRMAETSGKETGTRPLTVGEIAANWGEELKDTLMRKYGYTQDELVHAFGDTRDEWIARDEESWLEANSFYERLGVRDAARYSKANVYIITTKQTRFAEALLKHAGIEVPEDKVYGLGSGPKRDVLADLIAKHPKAQVHFVEDRVETLEGICKDERLGAVHLHLANWGFNNADQRQRGEANPRIEVISPERFREVMCAPVSAEAAT